MSANQLDPDGLSLTRFGVSLSIKGEGNKQWGSDRQCLACSWISKRHNFYKGSEAQHSSMPSGLSCDFIQFNKYLLCIFCQLKCKNSKFYLYPRGIKQCWNRQWALNKCQRKEGKERKEKKGKELLQSRYFLATGTWVPRQIKLPIKLQSLKNRERY